MNWSDFQGKNVCLLGAGSENIALIPFLQKAGAQVVLADQVETPVVQQMRGTSEIAIQVGEDYLERIERFDYIFRIAGLPTKVIAEKLTDVETKPIVTSPTDLFLALKPCHIIGVTGTKGKGTTSTMIGEILKAAGHDVVVIGNIGQPIFSTYDNLTPDSYAVLELSSFQLEDVAHSPEIAVLLPIGQDHLQPLSSQNPNYHPDLVSYIKAKGNIAAYQQPTDLLVFAADNDAANSIAQSASARRIAVGKSAQADWQLHQNGELSSSGRVVLDLKKYGVKGSHFLLDAALAVALAFELEVSAEQIERGLHNFRPLPHRLEEVGTFNGALWVDDSYATSPEAAIGAIEAYDEPILWIAGGSSKGADFTDLAQVVAESSVKQVILLGDEAERLKTSLQLVGFNRDVVIVPSLQAAVATAKTVVEAGDVVLLSPACASFGMFKSAADRGEQFQQLVRGENGDNIQAP